jgi:phosphotransacetylase
MPAAAQSVADRALAEAEAAPPIRVAVVHPTKASVLEAAVEAARKNMIVPVLIGPRARIEAAAEEAGEPLDAFDIVDAEHSHEAAAIGAQMAATGRVAAIMKGALHTAELLQAVIAEKTLRTERRFSHTYVIETPHHHQPFMVTDSGVNILPDLATKADIARNAADLFACLIGKERPCKIAALAAVETVSPAMPATVDAAALSKMAERGQIEHAIIDGPLAFDNAISAEAARTKGIVSEVAGDPDVLLVPNLEAGNMLAKQLTFLGGADAAAVVLGARVPIVLPSRSDSERTRLLSVALAVKMDLARKEAA